MNKHVCKVLKNKAFTSEPTQGGEAPGSEQGREDKNEIKNEADK